jgi:hypothetical protein
MSNAFKLLVLKTHTCLSKWFQNHLDDPTIGCSKVNKQSSSIHKNMEIIDGGARCLLNYLIELKQQA